MDKQPIATNGNSGVGVSNPAPSNIGQFKPLPEDEFSSLKYVDDATSPSPSPTETSPSQSSSSQEDAELRPPGAKRGKATRGLLILATLAIFVIGFFFWAASGKKKVALAVRDQRAPAGDGASQKIDDVTAQAIAEVRGGANALPAASPATAPAISGASDIGAGASLSSAPVTIPLGGTVAAVESATASNAPVVSSTGVTANPAETVNGRNTESSIRCAPVRPPVAPTPARPAAGAGRAPAAFSPAAEKTVTLPPFGAMLPVRTLGAIYTLRQSMARLELTRDLRGQGWTMKKGTILIGQLQGSEVDRAYVSVSGFIDPDSGKLVKLSGDALGADGAPGLRGKRRQISSRWARILSRAATTAVSLGQAALSRGGTTVNVPGVVSPELQGLDRSGMNRGEFVEVPAGATAFVLVNDLPKEAPGVSPQPPRQVVDNGGAALGDEELANLLTGGSSEEIRAALPRMTPELRRIAESVLRESGKSDVTEGSIQRKR
jgi:hypothetical protein